MFRRSLIALLAAGLLAPALVVHAKGTAPLAALKDRLIQNETQHLRTREALHAQIADLQAQLVEVQGQLNQEKARYSAELSGVKVEMRAYLKEKGLLGFIRQHKQATDRVEEQFKQCRRGFLTARLANDAAGIAAAKNRCMQLIDEFTAKLRRWIDTVAQTQALEQPLGSSTVGG